ncbi:MAG: hypothetical protein WA608_19115 [Candidatus Acidiferrales bacterium]
MHGENFRLREPDNSETLNLLRFYLPYRDDASAVTFVCADQLFCGRLDRIDNHVRKKNDEWFLSHNWPSAGNRVGQTERFLLFDISQFGKCRELTHKLCCPDLLPFFEEGFKFSISPEVGLQDRFTAPRHHHNRFDS